MYFSNSKWCGAFGNIISDWLFYLFTGANVHYTVEDYPKAIEDGLRAIEIDPNYGKAYYRLGMAYNEIMGQEDSAAKAIEMFEHAARLDPENNEVRDQLDFTREETKEDEYVPVPAEKVRF